MSQQYTIENFASRMSNKGWIISMYGNDSMQLTLRREWSKIGIAISIITLFLYGLGLVVFLLVVADYLLKSDKIVYITKKQILDGQADAIINEAVSIKQSLKYFAIFLVSLFICSLIVASQ